MTDNERVERVKAEIRRLVDENAALLNEQLQCDAYNGQLCEQITGLERENAELDAALAASIAATDKAQAQAARWMHEARYWYARAQRLATTGVPYPVMDGPTKPDPVPVILGGVQVAEL